MVGLTGNYNINKCFKIWAGVQSEPVIDGLAKQFKFFEFRLGFDCLCVLGYPERVGDPGWTMQCTEGRVWREEYQVGQPYIHKPWEIYLKRMFGTFRKAFSQVGTSQGYFSKWQLPKWVISQVPTSQMGNFSSANFPSLSKLPPEKLSLGKSPLGTCPCEST